LIVALFPRLLARIEAGTSGYLPQMGWIESRARRRAIDAAGQPIPWFTYPAVRLLEERVRAHWRVLEFGAGGGTLWWAGRVREIVAVEHHAQWAKQVASSCSARVLEVGDASAADYTAGVAPLAPFDVVVVDGLFRNECLALAPSLLAPGGVVVLDDAQRPEYAPGSQGLLAQGFRLLPLHGPQPVSKHPGCTSFFYRGDNALGL
jgi:SAM-dependent methyltransferase